MIARTLVTGLLAATLWTSSHVHAQAAPKKAAVVAPAFGSAEELLSALETADATITTITADLVYDRTFALEGDRQTRRGKLYFDNSRKDQTNRRFAILFDMLIVGKRLEREEKSYVFDGRFLTEKLPKEKLYIRREIVREGESFDPLKLGEGPFPVPIGQKKDDILSRYEASLAPLEEALDDQRMKDRLTGSTQLKLIPRNADDDFKEIRVWYKSDGEGKPLMPRMARTINRADDVSTVLLLNVVVDAPLPDAAMQLSEPSAADGWDVRIESWRGEAPAVTPPEVTPVESGTVVK